jgi:hypothetical protein
VQDSLLIGVSGAASANVTNIPNINQVPEPSTLALLFLGVLFLLPFSYCLKRIK